MKRLILVLAIMLFCVSGPAWAWAGEKEYQKEYQDCLRLQEQGYAVLCMPPQEWQAWEGSPEEKKSIKTYEVTVTITYNQLSEIEAGSLTREILARHGEKSCDVEINIKANIPVVSSDNLVIWTDDSVVNLTNDNITGTGKVSLR